MRRQYEPSAKRCIGLDQPCATRRAHIRGDRDAPARQATLGGRADSRAAAVGQIGEGFDRSSSGRGLEQTRTAAVSRVRRLLVRYAAAPELELRL
jgi:hypothetical protein